MVPIGTAPDECAKIKKKLKKMNSPNRAPGTSSGDRIMLVFQSSPWKNFSQRTSVGRRKKSKKRESAGTDCHQKELDTRTNQNRQQHRVLWWPENVSVDQLPAHLVNHVVVKVDFIVFLNIISQCSD
ncbi:hypothetical protein OGATHE_001784 [Ogataea polymorpha]|uniref:Uncharacterized protein n=1 Tax=Ogataea polymorpha TaxID=460523 RepID=A0A9P8TCL2_9ASCO|nr:hypothetical protein OGATHE_001784 [Ogataea polymorpha]